MKHTESINNAESIESSFEELTESLLNSEALKNCAEKDFNIEDEDFLEAGKLTTHIMDRLSEKDNVNIPVHKNKLFSGLRRISQEELSKRTIKEGAQAMRELYSGEEVKNLNSLFISISQAGVEMRKTVDDNDKMDKFTKFQVKVIQAAT